MAVATLPYIPTPKGGGFTASPGKEKIYRGIQVGLVYLEQEWHFYAMIYLMRHYCFQKD